MCPDTRSHLSPLCPHHQVKGKKGWVVSPPRARDGEYTERRIWVLQAGGLHRERKNLFLVEKEEERSLFLTEGRV